MVVEARVEDVDTIDKISDLEHVAGIDTVTLLKLLETVQTVETVETLQAIQDSVDTNHYQNGNAGDEDGSAYPYTISPAETVKELGVQIVEAEIVATITTTSGRQFDVPFASETVWNRWDIESVEFRDPDGTNARVVWWWAGE